MIEQQKYIPPEIKTSDLQEIFPSKDIADFQSMGAGAASGSQIVTFKVDGQSYVGRRSGGIFGLASLPNEFAAVRLAASAGVAAEVIVADTKTNLIVTKFVPSILTNKISPDPRLKERQHRQTLMHLFKKLHSVAVAGEPLRETNILRSAKEIFETIPTGYLPADVVTTIGRALATPWPTDRKSLVHGDPHARNILFTGENFYLVDWEMAGISHPFTDVAYFANSQSMTRSEGHQLLTDYLEHSASDSDRNTLDNLRRITSAFSALVSLQSLAENKIVLDAALEKEQATLPWRTLADAAAAFDVGTGDYSKPSHRFRMVRIHLALADSF